MCIFSSFFSFSALLWSNGLNWKKWLSLVLSIIDMRFTITINDCSRLRNIKHMHMWGLSGIESMLKKIKSIKSGIDFSLFEKTRWIKGQVDINHVSRRYQRYSIKLRKKKISHGHTRNKIWKEHTIASKILKSART